MCGRLDGSRSTPYNSTMTQLTIEQANGRWGDLVDAAIRGEDVVVIDGAKGAVRLVPVKQPVNHPRFGSAKGLITMADDFDAPLEDFREYME